jgi:hypothetical protein
MISSKIFRLRIIAPKTSAHMRLNIMQKNLEQDFSVLLQIQWILPKLILSLLKLHMDVSNIKFAKWTTLLSTVGQSQKLSNIQFTNKSYSYCPAPCPSRKGVINVSK